MRLAHTHNLSTKEFTGESILSYQTSNFLTPGIVKCGRNQEGLKKRYGERDTGVTFDDIYKL